MRFVLLLFVFSLAVDARLDTPKVLAIQIDRCPLVTYSNLHEEEEITKNKSFKFGRSNVQSDFDETLRFLPNENGTLKFFVAGPGNLSIDVLFDKEVLSIAPGSVKSNAENGGVFFDKKFKVLKPVRETAITVVMKNGKVIKKTTIYASTKSLEPPRPPSLTTSVLFDDKEIAEGELLEASISSTSSTTSTTSTSSTTSSSSTNSTSSISSTSTTSATSTTSTTAPKNDVTPPPQDTPSEPIKYQGNTGASYSHIEIIKFPSVDEVINGQYSSLASKTLRLHSINMNRVSRWVTDRYVSHSNIYQLKTSDYEEGFMQFFVTGEGKITVAAKSIAIENDIAKVANVAYGVASFSYTVDNTRVRTERLLVRVSNDRGEKLFFYVVVTRNNWAHF